MGLSHNCIRITFPAIIRVAAKRRLRTVMVGMPLGGTFL
jgi:hypothetical protein